MAHFHKICRSDSSETHQKTPEKLILISKHRWGDKTNIHPAETSATDSKIIIKDAIEQNRTDSRDGHMESHQVLFCSVVPFIIIVAVSVVAVTVFIDKISNHSETNIHSFT